MPVAEGNDWRCDKLWIKGVNDAKNITELQKETLLYIPGPSQTRKKPEHIELLDSHGHFSTQLPTIKLRCRSKYYVP